MQELSATAALGKSVTADSVKQLRDTLQINTGSGRADSAVTAGWLQANRDSLNNFVVNTQIDRHAAFKAAVEKANEWQTTEAMDTLINAAENYRRSDYFGWDDATYTDVLNGLKQRRKIYAEFSDADDYNQAVADYQAYQEQREKERSEKIAAAKSAVVQHWADNYASGAKNPMELNVADPQVMQAVVKAQTEKQNDGSILQELPVARERIARRNMLVNDASSALISIPDSFVVKPLRAATDIVLSIAGQPTENAFTKRLESYSEFAERVNRWEAQQDALLTTGERMFSDVFKTALQTMPYFVVSYYCGNGGSLASQASRIRGLPATTGNALRSLATSVKTSSASLFSNPTFWMTAVSTGADAYLDAKENGARLGQRVLSGVMTGLLNGAIELGGGGDNAGMQTFVQDMKNISRSHEATEIVKRFVSAAMAEGLEEVEQNVVTSLVKKATYAPDMPLLNTGGLIPAPVFGAQQSPDEEAVVNVVREVKSYLMGVAVSAITTAPSALRSVASVKTNTESSYAFAEATRWWNTQSEGLQSLLNSRLAMSTENGYTGIGTMQVDGSRRVPDGALMVASADTFGAGTAADGQTSPTVSPVDKVVPAVADDTALGRHDSRQYADFGWVAANRVLTGNEQTKLYSQFADAVAHRAVYPTTRSGEKIITVGDAYGDANKLVYISGTLKNPIISRVVEIVSGDPGEIRAVRQNVIDNEVAGYEHIWDVVTAVFGQDVFRIQASADFESYRELAGARENRPSDNFDYGDRQQRSAGDGSGAENSGADRDAVIGSTASPGVLQESGTVGSPDYALLEQYDSRQYAEFGWTAVNRVLTGNEQTKLYSQFADAVAHRAVYPTTSTGERIITVGDAYNDANKLVYIGGTLENPIVSRVVEIVPSDSTDIGYLRELFIESEVTGRVDLRADAESIYGEGLFRSVQSGDFASYRELAGARENRPSDNFDYGDRQQRSAGDGSGAENSGADRDAVIGSTASPGVLQESGTVGSPDYALLEQYDSRQYAEFGWTAVNRVLTENEQTKLYSQFADAVAHRAVYPTTRSGEAIITVGDAYGDANKLVYISGTLEHPRISKVVQLASTEESGVSELWQFIIDCEEKGHVDPYTILEDFAGEGVFLRKSSEDYASYRELQNRRTERGSDRTGDPGDRERLAGDGSGTENYGADRRLADSAVTNGESRGHDTGNAGRSRDVDTNQNERTENSLPWLNDGAGTDTYTQNKTDPQPNGVGQNTYTQNRMILPEIVEDTSWTKAQRRDSILHELRKSADAYGVPEEVTSAIASVAETTGTYVVFVDRVYTANGRKANGKYVAARNMVLVSADTEAPVYEVVKHELAHSISDTPLYDKLTEFVRSSSAVQQVLQTNGIEFEQLVEAKIAEYAAYGERLDYRGAVEEIVADYAASYLMTDTAQITALLRAQKNVFYKLLYTLRSWAKHVRSPKDVRLLHQAERCYAAALADKGKRYYQSRYELPIGENSFGNIKKASPPLSGIKAEKTGSKANEGTTPYDNAVSQNETAVNTQYMQNGEKYAIRTLPDGKRYVQADRQVIHGDDPRQWEQQIKDYVNEKVLRDGRDMEIVTAEGDTLTINGRTAWKLGYWNDASKQEKVDQAIYRTKGTMAGHIDELVEISDFHKYKPYKEHGRRGKPFGVDGFDYRTAYFLDFDGSYYRMQLSVGIDGDLKTVYNIGDIKKVPFPHSGIKTKMTGSKAWEGTTPYDNTVSQNETAVNTQYMQNGERYTVNAKNDFIAAMNRTVEQYGRSPASAEQETVVEGDQRVARLARQIGETPSVTPDWFLPQYRQQLLTEAFSYRPQTNRSELDFANRRLEALGFEGALEHWRQRHRGTAAVDGNMQALGTVLLHEAARRRNEAVLMELNTGIALDAVHAGQAIQAVTLIKNATPEGRVYVLNKMVNRMNSENGKKHLSAQKRKQADAIRNRIEAAQKQGAEASVIDGLNRELNEVDGSLYLPSSCIRSILSQSTPEGLDAAVEHTLMTVGKQRVVGWAEKWNQWRYLSMLGNLRTHGRNFISNLAFAPVVQTKNLIKFGIESMAGNRLDHKTATLSNRYVIEEKYRAFVFENYKKNQKRISSNGKYNPVQDAIRENQTVFRTKPLEWLRKRNFELLEAEDRVALRFHYTRALAQYLSANNVDPRSIDPEVLANAEVYAEREARKATFRDESRIADWLQRLSDKNAVTRLLVEGVVPFKKTPANILKLSAEYSPVGLIGATIDLAKLKRGDPTVTADNVIDKLSAGLTGTLLVGLGALLRHFGVLSGAASKSTKERKWDELQGRQEYAISIGDRSYTLDWLAPFSLPLFTGVQLYEELSTEGVGIGEVLSSLTALTEPVIEMSMLQSVQSVMESASYGGNLFSMLGSAATSYVSQAVPTIGGQVARVLDDTRRESYVESGSAFPDLQYTGQQIIGKLPGLESTKKEYVNQWGETVSNGHWAERVFSNLLSPSYYKKKRSSTVDSELDRLYSLTGDGGVLPSTGAKSFSANGKTYRLSAEESTAYQKKQGETAYAMLKKLMEASAYRAMDDDQRTYAVKCVYEYAADFARKTVVTARGDAYELSSATTRINTVISKHGVVADYLLFATWNRRLTADVDRNGKAVAGSKKKKLIATAKEAGYTYTELRLYMEQLGYSM